MQYRAYSSPPSNKNKTRTIGVRGVPKDGLTLTPNRRQDVFVNSENTMSLTAEHTTAICDAFILKGVGQPLLCD